MNDLLLLKFIKNETTEAEVVQVLDWLDANPENQRYLDELDFVSNAGILSEPVCTQAAAPNKVIPFWRKIAGWSTGAAAVLAVCIGISYLFAREIADRNAQNNMTAITSPAGQRMSVTLSDGTLVWLNAGTKLEYPPVFPKKNRRVRVSGEAMFEVEHDAKRPFIVETFAYKAEVLGTKFNICADPEQSYFSASLLEGKLKVSSLDTETESVLLLPDEMVESFNGRLTLNKMSDHDDFMWIDGLLNLDNIGFSDVMRKFEKYYGVRIVVMVPEIPQMKYKGKIRVSDGVEYALKMLQLTSDFSYSRDDETNTIYIK